MYSRNLFRSAGAKLCFVMNSDSESLVILNWFPTGSRLLSVFVSSPRRNPRRMKPQSMMKMPRSPSLWRK